MQVTPSSSILFSQNSFHNNTNLSYSNLNRIGKILFFANILTRVSGIAAASIRDFLPRNLQQNKGYATDIAANGTSFAAPQVTAVAAQIIATYKNQKIENNHKELTPKNIECILISTAYGIPPKLNYLEAVKLAAVYDTNFPLCDEKNISRKLYHTNKQVQVDVKAHQVHLPRNLISDLKLNKNSLPNSSNFHINEIDDRTVLTPKNLLIKISAPKILNAESLYFNDHSNESEIKNVLNNLLQDEPISIGQVEHMLGDWYRLQMKGFSNNTHTDIGKTIQAVIDKLAEHPAINAIDIDTILLNQNHLRGTVPPSIAPTQSPTSAPTYAPTSASHNNSCFDPLRSQQWHLNSIQENGIGVDGAEQWLQKNNIPSPRKANILVGVADTGYAIHPDLINVYLPGFDFVTNSKNPLAIDPHGVQVAGVITQDDCNQISARGVTDCKIVPAAVSEDLPFVQDQDKLEIIITSIITKGILWLAGIGKDGNGKANPNPVKVINMSIGYALPCNSYWQEVIDTITEQGITIVASAGNSEIDTASFTPAGCNNVISVGATDRDGKLANFSNFNATLYAPGVDILSTVTINGGSKKYTPLSELI